MTTEQQVDDEQDKANDMTKQWSSHDDNVSETDKQQNRQTNNNKTYSKQFKKQTTIRQEPNFSSPSISLRGIYRTRTVV